MNLESVRFPLALPAAALESLTWRYLSDRRGQLRFPFLGNVKSLVDFSTSGRETEYLLED